MSIKTADCQHNNRKFKAKKSKRVNAIFQCFRVMVNTIPANR